MIELRRTMCVASLLLVTAALLTGLAWAGEEKAAEGEAPPPTATAVAVAAAPASPPEQPKPDVESVAGRVGALEKENVVLREDLGKARLSARTDLNAAEARFAEAIAKVKRDLRAAEEKMEAERKAQAKRNRNFWIAIGVVAIAVAASD